jgi:hypothetical protein
MPKTYSLKQLEGFTVAQLKKLADLNYNPEDTKGLRKAQLVELLDKHYNPPVDDEVDDELDDEVDDTDDELDDEEDDITLEQVAQAVEKAQGTTTPPEPTGDTLTAKQVATRLGTDAKTLRKFFRTGASRFKAVGQGGRYEFAKDDLPAIKAAFEAYNSGKTPRAKRDPADKAKPTGRMATAAAELEDDEEIDDEPELEDLEDLELDDTELDDLELDDDEEDD